LDEPADFPSGDGSHSLEDEFGRVLLREIAGGAVLEEALHVLLLLVGGEGQKPNGMRFGLEAPGHLYTRELRHFHVQQQYVWMLFLD
jgi:hypothetical protein